MTLNEVSQFNHKREDAFVFGDPEVYGGIEVAGSVALFEALAGKGLSPVVMDEPLLYVIDRLPDESERALGLTLLTPQEAGGVFPEGDAMLAQMRREIGYSFSWTFTQDGDDITEIFVVIDPDRVTPMTAVSREEDMGPLLSLNHYLATQLVLIGQGAEPAAGDGLSAFSKSETSAAEDAASALLSEAIDKTGAPLIAIAPVEESA